METDTVQEPVGQAPPKFSFKLMMATIRRKGIFNAMNDEEIGPHVHLTYLMIAVAIVAIIVSLVLLV